MRVSVKFFGRLRDNFGKEESFDLFPDSKPHLLSEIFNELSKRKGEVFLKAVYESDGRFNPHISVVLNEGVVTKDDVMVDHDCSILFIPFVDGG